MRKEILSLNLAEAGEVGLPPAPLSKLLQGRICFSWKTIVPDQARRSRRFPMIALWSTCSLKWSLRLFERQREAAKSIKASIDEDIPNLFFGFLNPRTHPRCRRNSPADGY